MRMLSLILLVISLASLVFAIWRYTRLRRDGDVLPLWAVGNVNAAGAQFLLILALLMDQTGSILSGPLLVASVGLMATSALLLYRNHARRMEPHMLVRFSDDARGAIERAKEEASARGRAPVTPMHVLLARIGDHESATVRVLESAGIDVTALEAQIVAAMPARGATSREPANVFTNASYRVLSRATREAFNAAQRETGVVHLLAALMLHTKSEEARLLGAAGARLDVVRTSGGFAAP